MAKEISIGVKLVTDLKDFTSGFKQAQDTSKKFGDNIEKNVSTPLNKLAGQLRTLKAAQSRSLTPEQFASIGKEIQKVQGDIDKFKGKITQSASPISNLLAQAKGLLPAFGFAAIAAGAAAAFQKIVSATDTLGTDWDATLGGMNEGLNEFWRTIATGDWTNFIDRMEEAIKLGNEYVYTLDDLEEKTRGLKIAEADARGEELRLEEALKNKTLSNKDRLKAGQDRIKLEETLAAKRITIAQQAYNAEADLTASQAKLSKEQLLSLMKDLDSETKAKAKAYNEERASYKKSGFTDAEINNSLVIGKDATDSVKVYAELYRNLGRTTDEQLEKMTTTYVAMKEAENSAAENTKKVRTQVNTLLAEGNDELAKTITLQNKIAGKLTGKGTTYTPLATGRVTGKLSVTATKPVSTKTLDNMGDSIDANTERLARFREEYQNFVDQPSNLEILSGQFDMLGNSIGGAAGSFLNMVSTILGLIPSLIAQIAALTTAQVTSSASVTAAKGSEAVASGVAASQSVPFPLNLIALAVTVGSIVAALATGIKGFAVGGVVPGSSFTGDKVLARVNSGEEILTASDPRHRNNRSGSGTGGGSNVSILSEAKIKGEDLYILLKKAEQRINRRT